MKRPVLVVKFGGTSLGTAERFQMAARRVDELSRNAAVVVVVSAPGRTTDQIGALLTESCTGKWAPSRESERALATGENLSAAILASALRALGRASRSLTGAEAGLVAAGPCADASISDVNPNLVDAWLARNIVPVVAGFQAVDGAGETVTLGRGGSDLTAIALADALKAECHLVTDVDGVFERDPRHDPSARLLPWLDHDELCRLCQPDVVACPVVQYRAAERARATGVPLRIYHFRAPVGKTGGTTVARARRRRRSA